MLLQVHVGIGGDDGAGEAACTDEQICAALQTHLSLDAAPAFAASRPAINGAARATDHAAARAAQRPSDSHRVGIPMYLNQQLS